MTKKMLLRVIMRMLMKKAKKIGGLTSIYLLK